MKETISALAIDLERRLGFRVQIRVGMNSGEVVVRASGVTFAWTTARWPDHASGRAHEHLPRRVDPGHRSVHRLTESSLHFKPMGLTR